MSSRPLRVMLVAVIGLAAVVVPTSVASQDRDDPMDPAGYSHDYENGCGPFEGPDLVPDWDVLSDLLLGPDLDLRILFGAEPDVTTFRDGCFTHDACYGTIGAGQWWCDWELGTYMVDACIAKYGPLESWGNFFQPWRAARTGPCITQANIMTGAVLAFGASPYSSAQFDAKDSVGLCGTSRAFDTGGERLQSVTSGLWLAPVALRTLAEGGCHPTSVTYGDGRWVAVASDTSLVPSSRQRTRLLDEFDDLERAAAADLAEGFVITSVAGVDLPGGKGHWYLITELDASGGDRIHVDDDLDTILRDLGDGDRRIVDLEYDGEDWIAVTTDEPGPPQEVYRGSAGTVATHARERGEQGAIVLQLERGPDDWVMVTAPPPDGRAAAAGIVCPDCDASDDDGIVPYLYDLRVGIESSSDQGLVISDIEYGSDVWMFAWYEPAEERTLDPADIQVQIPDVRGMTLPDARATLEAAGFEAIEGVGRVDVTDPDQVDRVVSQDPAGGTFDVRGTDVVVSLGRLSTVTVPDVVGLTLAAAQDALDDAGLVMVVAGESEVTDPSLVDRVVVQSIGAGGSVAVGTEVTVRVGVLATATVPDVVGLPLAEARAEISGAGFDVAVVETVPLPSGDPDDGLVVGQDPAGGADATPGTTVSVSVGAAAEAPTVPAAPGSLSIVIRWGGSADFDLGVTEPNGERTSSGSPSSSTGGRYAGDFGTCEESAEYGAYESVWWTSSPVPTGRYELEVFAYCAEGGSATFTVEVLVDDETYFTKSVTLAEGDTWFEDFYL